MMVANAIFNLLVAGLFIYLNQQAIVAQLEETFLALTAAYAIITVIGNALFFAFNKKRK